MEGATKDWVRKRVKEFVQNAKGTKDFPPEEEILRQRVLATLKSVFERYGFNPLDTPILERLDVLDMKYAGGSEIRKEIFTIKNQGDRDLALRYDLTVPLARFIGMNPNIKIPFKRYQIGAVFRDGPTKLGRYRQFMQCDADVVGNPNMAADAEILMLTQTAFEKLGLDIVIKVNNRKILNGIIESAGVKTTTETVILTLDKLEKIGEKAVKEELKKKVKSEETVKKLMDMVQIKGTFEEKIEKLKKELGEDIKKEGVIEVKTGLYELKEVFKYLKNRNNVEFDVSLARGLSYYTGTIFEVFLRKSKIKSSVAAGGRYDNMIGDFLDGKTGGRDFSAVGISFGVDVIIDAISKEFKEKTKTVSAVYVIPIKTTEKSLDIAEKLRKAGIKTDIDLAGRGISKNLDYANSFGIPFVVFIGEEELKKNKIKLRNMETGKEEMLSVEECIKKLND